MICAIVGQPEQRKRGVMAMPTLALIDALPFLTFMGLDKSRTIFSAISAAAFEDCNSVASRNSEIRQRLRDPVNPLVDLSKVEPYISADAGGLVGKSGGAFS